MSWTDERVELLKKLWQDGLSASQIAAELGGVTRNAVIGKVHRLGLSGRAKSPAIVQPRSRKPASAPAPGPARAPSRSEGHSTPLQAQGVMMMATPMTRGNAALATVAVAEYEPMVAYTPAQDVVVPMSRRVSILELRDTMCRWPLGDPVASDFAFCGADCDVSRPYCSHHANLAFQPSHERRRRI